MFKHGVTGYIYYSVREKINYYTKVLNGNIDVPIGTKNKAARRLKELKEINETNYNQEPSLIITDDKHFGNGISKPRLCVVTGIDRKNRLITYPLNKRTTNVVLIPSYPERQLEQYRLLDKSDVYETKYINGVVPLNSLDKQIIKNLCKKNDASY